MHANHTRKDAGFHFMPSIFIHPHCYDYLINSHRYSGVVTCPRDLEYIQQNGMLNHCISDRQCKMGIYWLQWRERENKKNVGTSKTFISNFYMSFYMHNMQLIENLIPIICTCMYWHCVLSSIIVSFECNKIVACIGNRAISLYWFLWWNYVAYYGLNNQLQWTSVWCTGHKFIRSHNSLRHRQCAHRSS